MWNKSSDMHGWGAVRFIIILVADSSSLLDTSPLIVLARCPFLWF
ncbi:hypothetical protein [Rubritalea tangerina]